MHGKRATIATIQNGEGSMIYDFERVSNELVIKIAREISNQGDGDTYHGKCL